MMEIYLNGVLVAFLMIMGMLVLHSKGYKYAEYDNLTLVVSTILISATSWAFVVLKLTTLTVSMLRGNVK